MIIFLSVTPGRASAASLFFLWLIFFAPHCPLPLYHPGARDAPSFCAFSPFKPTGIGSSMVGCVCFWRARELSSPISIISDTNLKSVVHLCKMCAITTNRPKTPIQNILKYNDGCYLASYLINQTQWPFSFIRNVTWVMRSHAHDARGSQLRGSGGVVMLAARCLIFLNLYVGSHICEWVLLGPGFIANCVWQFASVCPFFSVVV